MPEIFYQPIRRRAFLRTATLAAGAAVITWKQSPIFGAEFTTASSIHLALLSDTHIAADAEDENRGFKPTQNLQQVVSEVLESEPEAALLCGDGARLDGQVGDYEALKSLLAPLAARIPISMNLGNHDDRDNFLQVFQPAPSPEAKVQGKYVLIHEWPRLRFVLLDSLLYVNKTAGLLGVNQRNWLERYLGSVDDRPICIFVHHTLGDGDGELLDADRLFAILKPHPQVKAVFYGHSHQYKFSRRDNIQLINLPAIGYNFNDREPVGWVHAAFRSGGVDLTLRTLGGNRSGDGKTTSITWAR